MAKARGSLCPELLQASAMVLIRLALMKLLYSQHNCDPLYWYGVCQLLPVLMQQVLKMAILNRIPEIKFYRLWHRKHATATERKVTLFAVIQPGWDAP